MGVFRMFISARRWARAMVRRWTSAPGPSVRRIPSGEGKAVAGNGGSPPKRSAPPFVSIVLGSYNRQPFLEAAIESVRSNCAGMAHEIIVIDGGSTDGSVEWLVSQKDILTIVQHNRGEFLGKPIAKRSWGYFMNIGFKAAQGDWILMISDDCLLLPESVGASLDTVQVARASGRKVGGVAYFFRNWPVEPSYYVQETLGARLMVNHGLFAREALEAVGYANEEDYTFYKADSDLSLRIWEAGFEIIPATKSFVEHYLDEQEAVRQSNNSTLDRDRATYQLRWRHLAGRPKRVVSAQNPGPQLAEQVFGSILAARRRVELG
jgi:glycosyltransferase involved in cell wall biosynthesis